MDVKMLPNEIQIESWQIYKNYEDLKLEVGTINDEGLAEECEEIHQYYDDPDVSAILFQYWETGVLPDFDRDVLEYFYILSHLSMFFGE